LVPLEAVWAVVRWGLPEEECLAEVALCLVVVVQHQAAVQ
jgi:hypothetical protein